MNRHVELSLEFALLAQCCRSNFPGADRAPPSVPAGIDWPRFIRLARFHRVQGLAWRALSAGSALPPDEVVEALSSDAKHIAASSLQAAAECQSLLAEFKRSGVTLLLLKGLTLGALAYGLAPVKAAVDIDLLIAPEDLGRVRGLLEQNGYLLDSPSRGDEALRRWHRVHKESSWVKSGSPIPVDLHTRVADNPRLIAGVDVNSPRQQVDIGNGIVLPTLAPEILFAYLAVHGASSAWFRLKWISDFAALASQLSSAELVRLFHRADQLGARRPAGQALLLADRLFATLAASPDLREELKRDAATRQLYRAALGQLAGRAEPVEPTASKFGTLTIHRTQFLLGPGAAFKGSELVRQVRSMLR